MKVVRIYPPSVDSALERLTFTAAVESATFIFHLYWDTNKWRGHVDINGEDIREIGVIPSVVNWSRYPDYSLVFASEYPAINQGNLGTAVVFVVVK